MQRVVRRDVIVAGGGIAGLSAAIYLGRNMHEPLIVDTGRSMARWEPEVQNYLGFEAISGDDLLLLGRNQARRYGATMVNDEILSARREGRWFHLQGRNALYGCRWLLLATGIRHVPPGIPGAEECVGKTLYFCKDCDAYRIRGRSVAVIGHSELAARYALSLKAFTESVFVAVNGHPARWGETWADRLTSFGVPVLHGRIREIGHRDGCIMCLVLDSGERIPVEIAFATLGDEYHHDLAVELGADVDEEGQIKVNGDMRTSVPGLYAAGCVTPANCQMIIAAGQGAAAAQAISADILEESWSGRPPAGHRPIVATHAHGGRVRGVPEAGAWQEVGMRIGDVMSKRLVTVKSVSMLPEAAEKMRNENIGVLPVVDDGEIVGMVTDRDIAIRAVANRKIDVQVKDVMTPAPKCVTRDASIEEAIREMETQDIRRLAVVDQDGKPCGIVSLEDLVESGEDQLVMGAIKKFHERTRRD